MKEFNEVKNEILNNKFYFKIVFNVPEDKVKDCIEVINENKPDFMEFLLPLKRLLEKDNMCELVIETKINSRLENIKLNDLYLSGIRMFNLDSVVEVKWIVFNEDNTKKYSYITNNSIEEFKIENK